MTNVRESDVGRIHGTPRAIIPLAEVVAEPPELETFAERIYASVEPLAWLDAEADYALAKLAGALGEMFQPVEDVARDTPEGPGWSAVVDAIRCPDDWLIWLRQFVGANGLRHSITQHSGFQRGTRDAIANAAGMYLTGNKTVYFRERHGDPYAFEVVTVEAETPDPAAVLAELIRQKPGGLVLTYRTVAGWDYEAMTDAGGTYATLKTTFATYYDLTNNDPV